MENLLSFDKPKKVVSTEEHNEKHMSDSGIAGTYVSNMSKEDSLKWKAKHIKGNDERIEIRKMFNCGVSMVMIVYKNPKKAVESGNGWNRGNQDIRISMNGKLDLTWDDFLDINEAGKEALEILL